MERELVLYIYLMILILSNTCRGKLSSFVKDVLWYSVFIILYRNIIERRVDDEEEIDLRLVYGTSWRFIALEEVEAWSLAKIQFTHDIQFCFKFR